mgnify:CR=1 FL=1
MPGTVEKARVLAPVPVELLLEAAAVEQAGQGIVVGQPAQLVLEAPALGDVLDLVEQVQRLVVGQHIIQPGPDKHVLRFL